MGCYYEAVAKVSVYIPDDLLDRVRSLDGSTSTSQLVQRGLERLATHLGGSDEPVYARRPEDAQDLLHAAHEKLMANARLEYERGYRAGAEDAGELAWSFMERLADMQFDLSTRLRSLRDGVAPTALDPGFSPPPWFGVLANRLGTLIDPIGFDHWAFTPTRPFVRGYAAALRDAWSTVEPDHGMPTAGVGDDTTVNQ
jgi:hypothetical protein